MELINHTITNVDKCASTKARRFYRILAGRKAPKRITGVDLNALIHREFNAKEIRAAREVFKMRKGANAYQRRVVEILNGKKLTTRITRAQALERIGQATTKERRAAIHKYREEMKAKGGIPI